MSVFLYWQAPEGTLVCVRSCVTNGLSVCLCQWQYRSQDVSVRQHTSAYVSIRHHTSAYVSTD